MSDRIGQTLNIQALQKRVLELWRADQSNARELGKALITTREAMRDAHGDFTQWFRDAGLSENRVYYCVRLVEGKVERAGIPKSPTAEYEKILAGALRDKVRMHGLSMEKLQPHHITALIDNFVLAFINALRDKAGILQTENQPPELEEYIRNFREGLDGMVATMYVEKEKREMLGRAA